MAKIKNKKKISADAIHKKKEQSVAKKSMNPFEIHINKEKFSVLGQKSKNDRGVPGISRSKAIAKRKDTLLKEYQTKNKSNKFSDKRIGEKVRGMSEEDKFMARFAATRAKTSRKSRFNLADDEELTHKGQSLAEIEKFESNKSDEDDESEDDDNKSKGNLDQGFVANAHFGGGLFRRTGKDGEKSHKDLINELIAESKKRKAEKQKLKEATLELTEKLDTEWKDLLPLVNKSKRQEEEAVEKPKVDDYDKVMRELRFEARGTVSDRLKTEDEIAREEKERLEELEKERIERMKGFFDDDKPSKPKHKSADDLDDDVVYEADPEYMLSYNQEGEANVEIEAVLNGKKINTDRDQEIEDGQEESDDENIEAEDDEEEEEESEDDLSDLKADSSESEDEIPEKEAETIKEEPEVTSNIKEELKKRKEMMEKAREELPYTFALPNSYEELVELFKDRSLEHQSVIIERMIKCNHPSLGENNKENLGILFAFLMQFLNDCGSEAHTAEGISKCFKTLESFSPHIFELSQLNPEGTLLSLKEVIGDKHNEFKKRPRDSPGIEILVFLKLVSLLCSTSDFRHHIVTPSVIFIEQLLLKSRINGRRSISFGLYLVTLILEYTALSKRYLPAAISFLGGLLHMAIPKTGVKLIKVLPPFKSHLTDLVLIEDCSGVNLELKMIVSDFRDYEIDECFKIRVLNSVLNLIKEFRNNFENLSSNVEIFAQIHDYLKEIPLNKYPDEVCRNFEEVLKLLNDMRTHRKLTYIVMSAQKPKALRLYEPKIVEIFDGSRWKKNQSKEKSERDKLSHKLKKETKGAIREIRRDKAFLGRVKIQQQIKSDKERMDKVKRIYAEASIQQGELNTLDRKKKKK